MLINEENNRNDLEEEFDNWVSDFMTKAYNQMDEDEYEIFCSNLENLLAQYTDPNFFPEYSEKDFISDLSYEEDDETWFSEAYTRGDIVKFDLGKDKNDFHHGVIMKAKNGKYTVRDESGNNVDIDDNMIIEKLEEDFDRRHFEDYFEYIEYIRGELKRKILDAIRDSSDAYSELYSIYIDNQPKAFRDSFEYALKEMNNEERDIAQEIYDDIFDPNAIVETVNSGNKNKKFFSVERIGFDGYLNWIEPNKYYKGNYRYICTCTSDDDNQDWDIVENNDTDDMFYTNI